MNNAPTVSVIVPVYKVEKYLKKCINSIINQTYKNLEIILVDDGSPDNCPQICDNYAKKDSRIKVIHKQNGGVSRARNTGMQEASGEYICFVDSDDWLPKDAIKQLVTATEENNADFCFGATTEVGATKENVVFDVKKMCIDKSDAEKFFSYISVMYTGPWAKLYHRQLLEQNGIEFPEDVKYGEDAGFIFKYFCACNRLCSINSRVYFYNRMVDDSATRKYHTQMHYWINNNLDELKKSIGDNTVSPAWNIYCAKRGIDFFKFCCIHHSSMCGDENEAISRIKECCDLFGEYFDMVGENEISKDIELQHYASLVKKRDYKGIYERFKEQNTKTSATKNRIRKFVIVLRNFWIFKIKVKSA